ncbi:hypothetical protein ENSA7_29540 [Enhygromyxa salina]|uniref:Uncharacterized protein n=2 Tax=Enhygromyxa salina TaxID=215803 RepID=A0A2S9YQ82_9BACT|nr:hypothetical protein ENSA7_29540 [Enhygromyxa salina]
MAAATSIGRTALSNQIDELTQRWLPMMLWRVGVSTAQAARMRVAVEGDGGLRDRLDFAQGAVMFAPAQPSQGDLPSADVAQSLIEIISELRAALAEADADLDGAQRRVDSVNRRLIRLVVGAPRSPRPARVSQRYEFGAGEIPRLTQANWWMRLFARTSALVR